MPGPIADPRAHALRARFHELFGGEELAVPVVSIAEDLLGLVLHAEELDGISGLLYPEELQIYVNASDVPARRCFTVAHEVGHWVCQCLEGRTAPLYCRAEDVSEDADRSLESRPTSSPLNFLCPSRQCVPFGAK
jgi:IrrE N-terminal-like domain